MLVKMERDNVSLKIENTALKAAGDQQKKKVCLSENVTNIATVITKLLLQISALEGHICKTEGQIDTLLYRLNSANDIIRHMKQEVSFLVLHL